MKEKLSLMDKLMRLFASAISNTFLAMALVEFFKNDNGGMAFLSIGIIFAQIPIMINTWRS